MDQAFVEKATRLVLDNLSDTDFTIDRLCQEMAMSRTLFYGKLKTLTGQGPQDFMRLIRLEQAALYLKQGLECLLEDRICKRKALQYSLQEAFRGVTE